MINKSLRRVLASVASTGLALAGFSAVATPAQAADPVTTTFKVHLNVPASVAADWNIWWWGVTDAGGPVDNTIGESTQTVAGASVTKDWTPNFTGTDAYGSYAEFDLPVAITALNNVMRTTESWDGQEAAAAVVDDPATTDVDETAAAKPAIEAADKPFGGDNIFPAGESWWNVNTQKREYPLKDTVDYKIHLNMSLANAQSKGWNLWTWGPYTPAQTVPLSKAKIGGKYPYKGKVSATITGVPFSGSDKYGAFAVIKLPRVYVSTLGFLVKRSTPTSDWDDNVKSTDFKSDNNNNVAPGTTEAWVQVGASTLQHKAPTFVGRYGATATYSNGIVTVTPVRPSHVALQGALADKIVVTIKKGATSKTCTIANTATAAADQRWATPASCDIAVAPGAEVAT